jgi:N-acetylglucosamine kinase
MNLATATPGVFGVDGGGTKMTGCLLGADGELLALGQAPAASYPKLRDEIAMPLLQFLRVLQRQAQLPETEIALAGVCSTGVGRERDRRLLTEALQRAHLAQKILVESDFMGALTGAFAGGPGIVVIAGTGAVAYARTPSGKSVRVGGWGYLLGDEGSGYHLVRQALNAALQNWDGRGEPTTLRSAFERHFGVAGIELILGQIYDATFDRGQMAALAPLVFAAADHGDRVAQRLIAETGYELGRLAQAALKSFEAAEPAELALLGGLFHRAESLLPSFWQALHEEKNRLRLIQPRFAAAIGAALLALQRNGFELLPAFWAKLESSYEAFRAQAHANDQLRS